MRNGLAPCLILAAAAISACTRAVTPASDASAYAIADLGCSNPESGVIKPESPGVPAAPLTGPFMVKSLMVGVDPANPNAFGSVVWSKGGVWFSVSDFKGPFYLGPAETLSAEQGKSPFAIVYSGCRTQ